MSEKEVLVQEETAIRKPKCIFDKVAVSFFSIICFIMSLLLIVIISSSTVMRYILKIDLYGYEEWIKIFAFWLYFMGAAYGAFDGSHIYADLVHSYVKEGPLKRFLVFVKTLITFAVTLLFTWYGYDFFMFGFRGPLGTGVAIPKTVAWRIPLWTAYLSVFLGLLSMSYYFVWDMIKAAGDLISGGKKQ